jgi:hypothetical protein
MAILKVLCWVEAASQAAPAKGLTGLHNWVEGKQGTFCLQEAWAKGQLGMPEKIWNLKV